MVMRGRSRYLAQNFPSGEVLAGLFAYASLVAMVRSLFLRLPGRRSSGVRLIFGRPRYILHSVVGAVAANGMLVHMKFRHAHPIGVLDAYRWRS